MGSTSDIQAKAREEAAGLRVWMSLGGCGSG